MTIVVLKLLSVGTYCISLRSLCKPMSRRWEQRSTFCICCIRTSLQRDDLLSARIEGLIRFFELCGTESNQLELCEVLSRSDRASGALEVK